jgi:uncharacterized protein YjbI with pentapeptide repeats
VKRKFLWFVLLLLCVLAGWALGYLRLPYIDHNSAFWVGFLACIVVILLIAIYRIIWNKNGLLAKWISKDSEITDSKTAERSYVMLWTMVSLFIILGGVLSGFMIWRQNILFTNQTSQLDERICELSEMTQSIRQSNQVNLMSYVLDQVDEDLKRSDERVLSDATIARIAALSFSFKPYRYFIGDSLSKNKLSPERGQLLVALVHMDIDSVSFAKIKAKTTFAYADLRNVNLIGADLSGIDLERSNLEYSRLNQINLSYSKLNHSIMNGATINNALINNVDFRSASLTWAEINDSEIRNGQFNGANLVHAQFINSNLSSSVFDIANLTHAILRNATLIRTDLARSNLSNADLSNVILTGGRLIKADIHKANLSSAILDDVEVQTKWIENLVNYDITGLNYVTQKYFVSDSTFKEQIGKYWLIRYN